MIRSEVGGVTTSNVHGYNTYNEIAFGLFQLAVDEFGFWNKGYDQSQSGYSTVKARAHVKGEDFHDLVDMGSRAISHKVNTLIDYVEFSKPCLYWLLPNCQMVVAINVKDLQ